MIIGEGPACRELMMGFRFDGRARDMSHVQLGQRLSPTFSGLHLIPHGGESY